MTIYIVAAGAVGSIVFSLVFLLMLIKGNSLKIPFIGMAAFVILMAAGVVLTMLGDKKDGPDTADKVSQAVESQGAEDTEGPESEGPEEIDPPTAAPTKEPEKLQSEAPEVEPPTNGDLDLAMSILRTTLSENFGENNYTLEYDNTGATINIWDDGVALGSALAASGDKSAISAWETMVDGQKFLCNSVSEQVGNLGVQNYIVMVNVLNDLDKDKTILSIMNGAVVYDAVNG